jgi:hypothetical protein
MCEGSGMGLSSLSPIFTAPYAGAAADDSQKWSTAYSAVDEGSLPFTRSNVLAHIVPAILTSVLLLF